MISTVIGWDIGGVNIKVARVANGTLVDAHNCPFEIQRAPHKLPASLRRLASIIDAGPHAVHAITMTAELSQIFRTKRDGVNAILDAATDAFPEASMHIYTVDGAFLDLQSARAAPLAVAASNWTATATIVAEMWRDCILIDIGTTTTDIIPISSGKVAAAGRTDPERLHTGELLYLGAVRTPVEAITHRVPLAGSFAGVSAEAFALSGDVHLWLGHLSSRDYSAPTPDGRPATRDFAGERLARVVCADRELLDEPALDDIANYVFDALVERIAGVLRAMLARHPRSAMVVTAGLGTFLGHAAAEHVGIHSHPLSARFGDHVSRSAPAAAVAILLDRHLRA